MSPLLSTTLHSVAVFGYTDGSGRFWSVPVDWADVQHRIMLPYPHGYQVRGT